MFEHYKADQCDQTLSLVMSLYARYVYCNITLVFGAAQSVKSVKPMIVSAESSSDVLICNIILVCNTEAQFWMLFSLKCGEESSVE